MTATDPTPQTSAIEHQRSTPDRLLFDQIDALYQLCSQDFANLPSHQQIQSVDIYFGDPGFSEYKFTLEFASDGLSRRSYTLSFGGGQFDKSPSIALPDVIVVHESADPSSPDTYVIEPLSAEVVQEQEVSLYSEQANTLLGCTDRTYSYTRVEVSLCSVETLAAKPTTSPAQARAIGASATIEA